MEQVVLQPPDRAEPRVAVRRDLALIAAAFAILSAAYWAAVLITCGRVGFPLDDAYIHLQFARHLFEDGQMAFNQGVPSSGSTAPLYAVLLAGVYALIRDWYAASIILGGLCSLGGAWVVYGILHSWTGRHELARWGGLLTAVTNPTVVSAYSGMETPVYCLLLLVGLWLYSAPQRRVAASAVLALCIGLRPEFLLLLPFIVVERAVAAYRASERSWARLLADIGPHVAIWAIAVLVYVSYHWHQDRHLVPSTFAAKAVAMAISPLPWLKGLPAALEQGGALRILLSVTVWPSLIMITAALGWCANCVPLGIGLRHAARATWHDARWAGAARRLALLILVGYPWLRGVVDPFAPFWFHFQRYYAHLTPLLILIIIGALPTTRAVLQWPRWSWRGVPLPLQQKRTVLWAGLFLVLRGAMVVGAVSNINAMQVSIGQWVRDHTAEEQLVATNDIGAIGFVSRRPILDTVGLVEPAIVEHYLDGGRLLEYLAKRKPAYVIVFPKWYPELCSRRDVLQPVHSVSLDLNLICGGPELVIYRPAWFGPGEE